MNLQTENHSDVRYVCRRPKYLDSSQIFSLLKQCLAHKTKITNPQAYRANRYVFVFDRCPLWTTSNIRNFGEDLMKVYQRNKKEKKKR